MTDRSKPGEALAPLFVMGMMPRSGSHFLANLLCLHPDCTKSVIAEDGLMNHAALLAQYVHRIHKEWAMVAGRESVGNPALLYETLGAGLITYLQQLKIADSEERRQRFAQHNAATTMPSYLVTKTPWVSHLELFFQFFPETPLLILVRDGRAVVESCVRSLQYEWEAAVKQWAQKAEEILQFARNPQNSQQHYRIVKYEELHTNPEVEMRKLLAFLGLDAGVYDFQAASNLPVVGSSSFKLREGRVHWWPVQKTAAFNPLERAAGWSQAQHARFEALAGSYLDQLGYSRYSSTAQLGPAAETNAG